MTVAVLYRRGAAQAAAPYRGERMTQQTERPPGFMPESENTFPFDPTDPAFRVDPYPVYNALRDNAPVMKLSLGLLVLSRHKDCVSAAPQPDGVDRPAQLRDVPGVHREQRRGSVRRTASRRSSSSTRPTTRVCADSSSTRSRRGVSARPGARASSRSSTICSTRRCERGAMELIDEFAYLAPRDGDLRAARRPAGGPRDLQRAWSRDPARGPRPGLHDPAEDRERMTAASKVLATTSKRSSPSAREPRRRHALRADPRPSSRRQAHATRNCCRRSASC